MLKKLQHYLLGNLRRQLITGMTLTVALTMVILIWNITKQQQSTEDRQHLEQIHALADTLATSAALWVAARDYSGLQETVSVVAHYPNLRHVIVLSLEGQVLAHNDRSKIGLYLTDLPSNSKQNMLNASASLIDVTQPIMLADKHIGWVRIGLSREAFIADIAKIRRDGVIYALFAILLSAVIAMLASRYLTRRLYAIQKVARAVESGESKERVVLTGEDEAAVLAGQFNVMLDSLALREEEKRANEAYMSAFYQLDLVGLTITSPDKGWVRINNCLCKMLEYSEQELLSMTWAELTHPDDLAADVEQFTKMLANEIQGYSLETRFVSKTGKVIPTQLVVRCSRKDNGEVDYVMAMVEDITERKLAEKATQTASQYSRSLIEASLDPLVTINAEGKITDVNTATENVTGIDRTSLIGSDFANYFIDPEEARKGYQQVFSQGSVTDYPLAIRHVSGKVTDVLYNASVYKDGEGKVLGVFAAARDVTERKQTEMALRESHQQIHSLLNSMAEGAYGVDISGNCTFVNSAFLSILGYEHADEIIGKHIHELIHHSHPDGSPYPSSECKMYSAYLHNQQIHASDEVFWRKDGVAISVEYWSQPIVIDSVVQGAIATFIDISERILAENSLRIAATAFESQEGMVVTDADNIILRVNLAFIRITGYSADEVIGQTPRLLSSGRHDKAFYADMWASINNTGAWEGEIWNRRKNGEVYPEHLTITAVKNASDIVTNYVATLTDITTSKAAAEKINNLAFYDSLTQLPNRRLLLDRLNHALTVSVRSGQHGALLFIDLDNFKTLNDTLGHDMGDLLLQQVASRLTGCVRECDTVARLGGDEFVVLLENLSEEGVEAAAQAKDVAEKILLTLNQHYQLNTHTHHSTPSIGATLFNGHKQGAEELLKQADIAMYQSKAEGRNTLRFFDPKMQEAITARVDMEQELRKAIEQNQFELHYQIQISSAGKAIGAEALIRWQHPERGMISPFNFIPLAEESGLILPIGQWVLDMACAQLKLWEQDQLTQHLTISVNVSAKQFHQADFVAQVQSVVIHHAINPARLNLELTESMLLEDVNGMIVKMNALKKIGIRFELDDFGTGYSSLQYLKRLPLHQLKIDRSFVRDIAVDSSDRALVRTIITMAHNLDLEVIAEGVETTEQKQLLLDSCCVYFQGYLFGKPMPIDEFEALLRQG